MAMAAARGQRWPSGATSCGRWPTVYCTKKNHYGCLVRDRIVEGIEDVLYDVDTYLDESD